MENLELTDLPDSLRSACLLHPHRKAAKRRREKYCTLAVSLLLGLVSGTLYGYGRYAKDLKDALGLSHFELELLGILLDTGNYISQPIIGHIYDHYGPSVSCVSGAVVVALSYGTIQLSVLGMVPPSLLCLRSSFFLAGFGSGLGYSAAVGSTLKSFQSTPYKSLAVGLVAATFALCSTLIGVCYDAFGLDRFFVMWAALVVLVNLLGVLFLSTDQDTDDENEADAPSDTVERIEEGRGENETLLLLVHGPPKSLGGAIEDYVTDTGSSVDSYSSMSDAVDQDDDDDDDDDEGTESTPLDLYSQWAALLTPEFWILFVAFACRTGCGLFVFNNISTMVQSIGGSNAFSGQLVMVLSISNCGGRILMGCLADRPNLDKLFLFRMALTGMAVALFLSAGTTLDYAHVSLILTVCLVAACYGGTWVLLVGLVSDWFGLENFGKNLGVMIMGPAFSGMMFNSASAWMYEQRAIVVDSSSPHHHHGEAICWGTACYRDAFLLTGCSALMCAFLLACLAYYRQRHEKPTADSLMYTPI